VPDFCSSDKDCVFVNFNENIKKPTVLLILPQRKWLSVLLFLFILIVSHVQGQNAIPDPVADSLKQQLRQHPQRDTTYAIAQIVLAYHLHFARPDTAILLANSALSISQKLNLAKGIGRAYHALATAQKRKGNDGKALDALLKAIPNFERANDKAGLVVAYRDIAVLDEKQKQIDRALAYYQKSYGLAKQINQEAEKARQLAHIAVVYNQYYHKTDTALTLLDQARNISHNNPEVANFILENLGYVFMNRQEYPKAIATFKELLEKYRQEKDRFGMATIYKALAVVYKRMGDYRQSLSYSKLAIQLATEIKEGDLRRGAAFMLADNYENLRDYKNALRYQRLGEQIKDSLFNIEKTLILNNLQTKFEMDSQRRAIDSQKREIYVQEQELSRKTFQRNAFIAGMALLALLAFLFYRNIVHQRHTNRLLTEKNAEIQQQKEQLTQLNATKDKLFSIISHDIRSPLNSLEATLQLLQEGYLSPEEMQAITPELLRKVHQTSALLHNILHWAKSQMDGIVAKPEHIDLQLIASELVANFRPIAQDKAIRLENLIRKPLAATADKNMTELILRNLLSNAIKFTPDGGQVLIEGASQADHITITVKDTGKGMTADQQANLFDMRTHFSTMGTANEVGTGLGLLLCKEFVEKNNGKIWVESQVGQGSNFNVSLPTGSKL
jgi:two-component system, sensor histidine kinase and response regulator